MKKTFLAFLTLSLAFSASAAEPLPAVSFRVEFGIYREITVDTNGLVTRDLFQKLSKGKLSHTLLTVTPNSNPTQNLFSATSYMIDEWGSGYTNFITTNSSWYTNGTVTNNIQTEWYLEEDQIHYYGPALTGHSRTTNSTTKSVKTTIAANTLWVWISNEEAIPSYCQTNVKPFNISAFLYTGTSPSNTPVLLSAIGCILAPQSDQRPWRVPSHVPALLGCGHQDSLPGQSALEF